MTVTEEQLAEAISGLTDCMTCLVTLMGQVFQLQLRDLILVVPLAFWVTRRVYKIFRAIF